MNYQIKLTNNFVIFITIELNMTHDKERYKIDV